MSNAQQAEAAVAVYRVAVEQSYADLRRNLSAIAEQADVDANAAGDRYHLELQRIADTEAQQRAQAHQAANNARAEALAEFTAIAGELQSGGPQ